MRLILARHGNTFAPGERVVWIGAREDKPLVASGIQQAQRLGAALQSAGITLDAVYCGSLQRSLVFAERLMESAQMAGSPRVDLRLNELDYGGWGGLSSAEIRTAYGDAVFEAWDREGQWPQNAGWNGSSLGVEAEVQALASELLIKHGSHQTVLCVSSNGRLRAFVSLLSEEGRRQIPHRQVKVATGHLCSVYYQDSTWQLDYWNQSPILVKRLLKALLFKNYRGNP